jgi:hypothetical protein
VLSRGSIRSPSSRRRPSWGNFSVNCQHDPYGPVHGCDSASGIGTPSPVSGKVIVCWGVEANTSKVSSILRG